MTRARKPPRTVTLSEVEASMFLSTVDLPIDVRTWPAAWQDVYLNVPCECDGRLDMEDCIALRIRVAPRRRRAK